MGTLAMSYSLHSKVETFPSLKGHKEAQIRPLKNQRTRFYKENDIKANISAKSIPSRFQFQVLVLLENDGRFDDVEEDLELKEAPAMNGEQ
ncbi:hypothetical protein RIF29_14500 [Crotalaria pallida]|uniref:Uncharacterized protein n=1 Tax=Crotalaria pallida TaxID=3830 RepID=A0AAN9FH63_CROPI